MNRVKSAWDYIKNSKFSWIIKNYVGVDDIIALALAIVGSLFYWDNGFLPYHEGWHNFYEKIHIDLLVIAITVLIIGNANQYIQYQSEKRDLIV